ncbi:hypothetical protein O9H85_30505 [Paenibacillus filicis]|uniref:Uncharacterized protein n=1 Tax=Paenibacillus gyeongsangnamensis TaxID=3388067 RepID=A0ABT4QID8_9BACL|nr:hypothetical protein [Paenibacillus filicis]MCZ8516641.1 hypothetical protein [Paenibacillus filicis]
MIDPHIFLHLIEHVKVASSSGHKLIGWSVDTLEWDGKRVSQILSNVRKEVPWLYNPAALCRWEKREFEKHGGGTSADYRLFEAKRIWVPELISAKKP